MESIVTKANDRDLCLEVV